MTGSKRCSIKSYIELLRKEAKNDRTARFTEKLLDLSYVVWQRLEQAFDEAQGFSLEVPNACLGSKDNFMYTWSKSEHYLECEIFGSGEIEFFYRNRTTGEDWGKDTTLDQEFSKDILHYLTLFTEDVPSVFATKSRTLEELMAKVTPENMHPEIDWGPAVGLERWWEGDDTK